MIKLEGTIWKSNKGKYWIAYIEFLDISTQGKSKRNSLAMIKDAIESLVNKKGFEIAVELKDSDKYSIGSSDTKTWLGFILQRLRMKAGFTIEEVAKRMGSTSKNAYARYEQGKTIPGLDKLSQILEAIESKSETILKIAA